MAVSLKLSQKGAILVAVPLFFELLFVFILVMLLQQADAEAQQQARSRAIIYQADDLSRLFHDANLTLLGYSSTRSPLFYDRFEELTGKIPSEIKALQGLLVGGEGSKSELLTDAQKGLDALCNARKFLVENSGNLADFSARHMFSAIASSTNELETKLKAFIHEQESKQHEHEVAQMLARTRLKWLIAVGVLFNILISLALTVFFVRGIGRRVDVLRDNAYRLAAGQKLNAPAFGDDEISELDGVFHQMARSLREAAQRESAIFENAMDVICSIDQNGRFATVSPASLKLLGFDPEDLIGTRFFELIVPEDVEAAREAVQRIMEGSTIEQCQAIFETRMTGKDGGERDVLWSACWSQEQQTVFAVVHDITERKEVERLKQEVVAMVSHDLRSPLTTIRHVLEMLDEGMVGSLTTEGARLVQVADRKAAVMLSLINDLLDIEKGKAGILELVLEEIPLNQIFEQCLQTVLGLAAERKVTINARPTNLTIVADVERLSRAIVNLLSNALKYSREGGTVSLSAKADGNQVLIFVADHGRGIPAHKLASVFDRFQQVDAADAKNNRGAGLGLTICKTFIELHGGTVEVESEVGRGSTFICKLPMRPMTGNRSGS